MTTDPLPLTFSRDLLTRWAATRGVDTNLFDSPEEWILLDGIALFHTALVIERMTRKP